MNAQNHNNNDQSKVTETITKFFAGIATLDTDLIKRYSTKNFLLLEDGAIWNMDTLISKLNQLTAISFSRTNHLNFIQTEVKQNSAWVAYKNVADMKVDGQKMNVQWLESAFLVKEGRNWKIRLLHSTTLKPEAQ